jgi:hypothetical protein
MNDLSVLGTLNAKRMQVSHSYQDGLGILIESHDSKTGAQDRFFIQHPYMLERVVRAVENREADAVRVFKAMKDFEDLPGLWLEEWKRKRCLHLGLPNNAAMKLLMGLKKPLRLGLVARKDGAFYRGGIVLKLHQAGLLRLRTVTNGGVYRTNLSGYEVLRHWAEKNKVFAPFLQAFLPEDWEENERLAVALEAMHGKRPDESADAPKRFGFITPAMKKLGMR